MDKFLLKISIVICFLVVFPNFTWGQQQVPITNLKNNPLPKNPTSLKILGIGNSFTDDGIQYLPDLLEHAGIDNVLLGRVVRGGCSLEKHHQIYLTGEAGYARYDKSYPGKNAWEKVKDSCRFVEAVADEAWDLIVIQQVSELAGVYGTFQPYLNDLIDAIVTNCPNAGVSLAWQMTWAYGRDFDHKKVDYYRRDQDTMFHAIINTVKTLIAETGIDIIIPSATAVQNVRNTALNNPPLDLTRDGYHIDLGAGRYLLACTWFQTLIAPCFNTSVNGNSFRVDKGNIPVADDNFEILQKAACYAVSRRFEISSLPPTGDKSTVIYNETK